MKKIKSDGIKYICLLTTKLYYKYFSYDTNHLKVN